MDFNGPFWQLREWCGLVNLCLLFADQPEFVQEMIDFWKEFVSQALARILKQCRRTVSRISEDMAYKAHSMISPAMVRKFLLPTYARWVSNSEMPAVQLSMSISDGYIGELIPLWIEAGINVGQPLEVSCRQ